MKLLAIESLVGSLNSEGLLISEHGYPFHKMIILPEIKQIVKLSDVQKSKSLLYNFQMVLTLVSNYNQSVTK